MPILTDTINNIKPLDKFAMSRARERQDQLTKPVGSLGRLEQLSVQLAGIQGRPLPRIHQKAVVVMVADHGVAIHGTSAYPREVTIQMVHNFLNGGAGINVICRQVGARVVIVDMGICGDINAPGLISRKLGPGTHDMCREPAMTIDQAVQSIVSGIEIITAEIEKGLDIVAIGEMGIGNTTSSAAICAAITGKSAAEVTGRGTGLNDLQLQHKVGIIEKALALHQPEPSNPLQVLSRVGGFEIGGLAGVILGAASKRVAVVIDGFISGAAALVAAGLCPQVTEYMIAGHLSIEPGHQCILSHLGLKPLLDLGMRLGEGTGAALGISLAETSCRILAEMATFAEAGVSGKGEG